MPSWLTEVLKLLGFTTPFLYAAVTYSLFHYLDKKASGKAKRAISAWLKPLKYDKPAVAAAIVEVFDRFYTTPLLGWRAFARSTMFSTFVFGLILMWAFVVEKDKMFIELVSGNKLLLFMLFAALLSNIISDYASLFVVRRWIKIGISNTVATLLTVPAVAAVVIVALFLVRDAVIYAVGISLRDAQGHLLEILTSKDYITAVLSSALAGTPMLFWIAVIAVYVWLPLFAFGVLVIKSLNSLVWAARGVQWFLKQGQHHPLQVIGYVAAVTVFVVTGTIQLMWRW